MSPVDSTPARADQTTSALLKRIRTKLQNGPRGAGAAWESIDSTELLEGIRRKINHIQSSQEQVPARPTVPRDFSQLMLQMDAALQSASRAHTQVGTLNPRPPGLHNRGIQLVKSGMRRSLSWYTRPIQAFQAAILRLLPDIFADLEHKEADLREHAAAIKELRTQNAVLTQELDRLRATPREPGNEIDGDPTRR